LFILLTVLLCIKSFVFASEEVSIYGYSDYAPYMYGNKHDAKGLYSDLIKGIFRRAGVEIKLVIFPWKRALRSAEKGLGGLAGVLKNQERLKHFDFSEAFFQETLSIYTPVDKSFVFNNLNDLAGKTIGIKSGFSYGEEFELARKANLFNVIGVKNDLQNFGKMLHGRSIDCLITDDLVSLYYLKNNNLNDKVKKLVNPVYEGKVFLIFAKKANKKGLLIKFNQALAEMKKDGSYQKIIYDFFNKYNV